MHARGDLGIRSSYVRGRHILYKLGEVKLHIFFAGHCAQNSNSRELLFLSIGISHAFNLWHITNPFQLFVFRPYVKISESIPLLLRVSKRALHCMLINALCTILFITMHLPQDKFKDIYVYINQTNKK